MTDVSELVKDAPISPAVQTPQYVDALAKDLELLLDVAFALRSASEGLGAEDGIARWLSGKEGELARPPRPHLDTVTYAGKPLEGMVKEYEVIAPSGEHYRFVVHPEVKHGITANRVSIKAWQTYEVGTNPEPGVLLDSSNHQVLYLLPLIKRLPIPAEQVTFRGVNDFLEKHNGFKYDTMRPEKTVFRDVYHQDRNGSGTEQPLQFQKRESWMQEPAQPLYHFASSSPVDVGMDVFLTVEKARKQGKEYVTLTLEIDVPKKKV